MSLFLRQGLIEIEEYVGEHHIGARLMILEIGREFCESLLGYGSLFFALEPGQEGIGFAGLRQTPGGEAEPVIDARTLVTAALAQDPPGQSLRHFEEAYIVQRRQRLQ